MSSQFLFYFLKFHAALYKGCSQLRQKKGCLPAAGSDPADRRLSREAKEGVTS